MKKFTLTQTLLLAALTLIIGLFIGLFIEFPVASTDELSGTIGKVSKYHNVQVTEDDILLRNELLEDTALRNQYDRYLTYYYYQSIKTSHDLKQVQLKTSGVKEFEYYVSVLKKFSTYLETARVDILCALNIIQNLDTSQKAPVITYLNEANNAIARLKNQNVALLSYLDAIEEFLNKNPMLSTPDLRDAHDILALNLMTSAAIADDKPALKYLDKKKLANSKDRVKELISNQSFVTDILPEFMNLDIQALSIIPIQLDQDALRASILNDFPIIVDQITVGATALLDITTMGNTEVLRIIILDQSPLSIVISLGAQTLGNDLLFDFYL